MKPADLIRELAYPFQNMAIVMAMIFFWLIFAIAKMGMTSASPVVAMLGLFLSLFILPACFRYMLYLLEARANKLTAPVASAELFSFTDNLWSLTPIIPIAALVWSGVVVSSHGMIWAMLFGATVCVLIPASFAVLAITHSPIESLNPVAITRMIRTCGWSYLLVPSVVVALGLLLSLLASFRLPQFLIEISAAYQAALFFTLTGAVLAEKDIASKVDIELPMDPGEDKVAMDLEKERERVAGHAYGFISRGNREGGFAHIMDWIGQEPDVHEATAWFFNAMMKWESKDAALFYAQTYLSHLLHHGDELKVLKLVSVCLHQNPLWKPKPEDRQHVVELARKYRRDDLLGLLTN